MSTTSVAKTKTKKNCHNTCPHEYDASIKWDIYQYICTSSETQLEPMLRLAIFTQTFQMGKHKTLFYCLVTAFSISAIAVVLGAPFSNCFPIVFGFTFYPILFIKMMGIAFKSSSYIKSNHREFYEKHETFTWSLDGRLVDLFSASDDELKSLNDQKVLIFKNDMKHTRRLLLFSFLGILLLALLTVFAA